MAASRKPHRSLPRLAQAAAVGLFSLLGLAACQSTDTHTFSIHTAATATTIEAKQVVALVYRQGSDAEIDKLLYSGGDLYRAIQRLRQRHGLLKPWLEQGAIGNTPSGFVVPRTEAPSDELRQLLRAENRDRALLYTQASAAVGHGGDDLNSWLPYASYSFGKEWIDQSPAGWWVLEEQGGWRKK